MENCSSCGNPYDSRWDPSKNLCFTCIARMLLPGPKPKKSAKGLMNLDPDVLYNVDGDIVGRESLSPGDKVYDRWGNEYMYQVPLGDEPYLPTTPDMGTGYVSTHSETTRAARPRGHIDGGPGARPLQGGSPGSGKRK